MARIEKGLTQKEVAEITNTTQSVVSNWENGYRKPSVKKLKALAHALGVAIEELLEDDFC